MAVYNMNSPAVRRLQTEFKQIQKSRSSDFYACPLEDNLFEWHFTIRGPPDTAFAEGVYHGRIIFPTEYPQKPPHFVLLTENGRFKVGQKICLSISAFHPEEWQPSWNVESMLLAIRAFMPTPAEGAIGAIDVPDERRRKLAAKSRAYTCEQCGMVTADMVDQFERVAASTAPAAAAAAGEHASAEAATPAVGLPPAPATAESPPPQALQPQALPQAPPQALPQDVGVAAPPAVTPGAAPDERAADAPFADAAGADGQPRRRRHPNEQPWERALRKRAQRAARHRANADARTRSYLDRLILLVALAILCVVFFKRQPHHLRAAGDLAMDLLRRARP